MPELPQTRVFVRKSSHQVSSVSHSSPRFHHYPSERSGPRSRAIGRPGRIHIVRCRVVCEIHLFEPLLHDADNRISRPARSLTNAILLPSAYSRQAGCRRRRLWLRLTGFEPSASDHVDLRVSASRLRIRSSYRSATMRFHCPPAA